LRIRCGCPWLENEKRPREYCREHHDQRDAVQIPNTIRLSERLGDERKAKRKKPNLQGVAKPSVFCIKVAFMNVLPIQNLDQPELGARGIDNT